MSRLAQIGPRRTGTRVLITEGSGLDSGKAGVIVPRTTVKTDHHLVPINVEGAYRPVDWRKEVAILLDDGTLITMFRSHLQVLATHKETEVTASQFQRKSGKDLY
jgi:hypothetical protein